MTPGAHKLAASEMISVLLDQQADDQPYPRRRDEPFEALRWCSLPASEPSGAWPDAGMAAPPSRR